MQYDVYSFSPLDILRPLLGGWAPPIPSRLRLATFGRDWRTQLVIGVSFGPILGSPPQQVGGTLTSTSTPGGRGLTSLVIERTSAPQKHHFICYVYPPYITVSYKSVNNSLNYAVAGVRRRYHVNISDLRETIIYTIHAICNTI